MIKKNIAVLGSSGSIGTQALDVIRNNPHRFKVELLTVNSNAELLIQQAKEFKPKTVVIADPKKYKEVAAALAGDNIEVQAGIEALNEAVTKPEIDIVLTALVGYAGLQPTIAAIKAGKNIALANKETLVAAGELVMTLAKQHNVKILPVDSEHSAIFQCLQGEAPDSVEKIILTASGGPFRGWTADALKHVSKAQALKHPNWSMGAKITIDSASLMNKGLEVIEARWLFDVDIAQIETVVHPQSIVHSLVQLKDGSVKAQLGLPDMKLPIQYALGYPERITNNFPRFSFLDYPVLTFERPDVKTFKNLSLAYLSLEKGGNMPCALNAANEIAVEAFLNDKIGFLEMPDLIEKCISKISLVQKPCLEDIIYTDAEARKITASLL